jgi:hypothetical protein
MTRELRWRIITLQVIMLIVFAAGAGVAYWAADFNNSQIKAQLEPQKIFFPKDVSATVTELQKYPDLAVYIPDVQKYQGQQVLNGDQAHIFAQGYLGLHLRELAGGKVYSELSTEARTETDPTLKAQKNALVDTAFRGETLRSMLNQAWAFSIFGMVGLYASIGLGIAALVVLGALVFELFFASKPVDAPVRTPAYAPARV